MNLEIPNQPVIPIMAVANSCPVKPHARVSEILAPLAPDNEKLDEVLNSNWNFLILLFKLVAQKDKNFLATITIFSDDGPPVHNVQRFDKTEKETMKIFLRSPFHFFSECEKDVLLFPSGQTTMDEAFNYIYQWKPNLNNIPI